MSLCANLSNFRYFIRPEMLAWDLWLIDWRISFILYTDCLSVCSLKLSPLEKFFVSPDKSMCALNFLEFAILFSKINSTEGPACLHSAHSALVGGNCSCSAGATCGGGASRAGLSAGAEWRQAWNNNAPLPWAGISLTFCWTMPYSEIKPTLLFQTFFVSIFFHVKILRQCGSNQMKNICVSLDKMTIWLKCFWFQKAEGKSTHTELLVLHGEYLQRNRNIQKNCQCSNRSTEIWFSLNLAI